ncbi:hypothetical protein FALCPG4_010781 [Fusarium falciforme]
MQEGSELGRGIGATTIAISKQTLGFNGQDLTQKSAGKTIIDHPARLTEEKATPLGRPIDYLHAHYAHIRIVQVRGPLQLNSSFDYFGGIRSLDPWSQLAPADRILESNPARYRSTYRRYRASVALKAFVPFVSSHGYLEQAILPATIRIPLCLLFLVDVF